MKSSFEKPEFWIREWMTNVSSMQQVAALGASVSEGRKQFYTLTRRPYFFYADLSDSCVRRMTVVF